MEGRTSSSLAAPKFHSKQPNQDDSSRERKMGYKKKRRRRKEGKEGRNSLTIVGILSEFHETSEFCPSDARNLHDFQVIL
ncbi:hypothetical protein KFK09_029018 [Dendrobium nobile]|uniref:Uncharacterized protein n=1 Tax=Dendrobium nobile TaxID=94219 RepID=A0A8T3A4B1_DENNO|nr:hypothetical protein KFK09_029018 [Dendrobium nobile]